MKWMKYLILLLLTLCGPWCYSQPSPAEQDSLLHELSRAKEDTNKVLLLIKVGYYYEASKPDSAKLFYTAAGNLAEKLTYPVGTLKYISYYTAVLNTESKYDESLQLNLKAISLAQKINNVKQLAVAYSNAGASYYGLRDFTRCIDCFLQAEALLNRLNEKQNLMVLLTNLTGLYNEINQNEKSYQFGLKCIALSKELKDDVNLANSLENTAQALFNLKREDTALVLLKQAVVLGEKTGSKLLLGNVGVNMMEIYYHQGKFADMKAMADKTLATARDIGNQEVIATALIFTARYYVFNRDFKAAKNYATHAFSIAQKNNTIEALQYACQALSDIGLATGALQDFYFYRKMRDSVEDIIISTQVLKNTQEVEAKYSLAKKETQINSLTNEKRIQALTIKQARTTSTALAVTLMVLAVAGFLFYRNVQQKKKLQQASAALQQQRIAELEIEKQFMAAQAVLKGQDEERSRLAKDLHDGLGGILSGAKYAFSNMKNNFIITPESAAAFDKSMAMLDKSISELRAVSHNMMPEALVQFGLDTALKDYCNSTQQTSALQITYQSYDVNQDAIAKPTASVVYRIVQELLNNIVKHAAAKTVLVQLVQKENSLSITVEDDGKGFDKTLLENAEGIGFKNILNRVTYLKGSIDIATAPSRGTAITIEIPNLA